MGKYVSGEQVLLKKGAFNMEGRHYTPGESVAVIVQREYSYENGIKYRLRNAGDGKDIGVYNETDLKPHGKNVNIFDMKAPIGYTDTIDVTGTPAQLKGFVEDWISRKFLTTGEEVTVIQQHDHLRIKNDKSGRPVLGILKNCLWPALNEYKVLEQWDFIMAHTEKAYEKKPTLLTHKVQLQENGMVKVGCFEINQNPFENMLTKARHLLRDAKTYSAPVEIYLDGEPVTLDDLTTLEEYVENNWKRP